MNEFYSDGADATYRVEYVNGGLYNPNSPGLEATTNVQYAAAMTYPTTLIFYTTGGTFIADDPLLKLVRTLLLLEDMPQTISISYGAYGVNMPMESAGGICYLVSYLGAFGVSVLVSTGDDGVGPGTCKDVYGDVHFIPTFPATCTSDVSCTALNQYASTSTSHSLPHHALAGPFVTSVGCTMNIPEKAASLSGGGFSSYFKREPYQIDAVDGFLADLKSPYDVQVCLLL